MIDIGEEMQRLTVNVIGKLGFDYNLSSEQTETAVHALQLGYLEFSQKYRKYPQRRLLGGLFYPEIRRARQAGQDLNSLGRTMLQHYRENESSQQEHQRDDAKPILHYIVNDKEYKDDEERVRDIVVYFAGGYDTTSYTISWILLELAKHPETQTWLRQEMKKHAPEKVRDCVALKHCIREGMRLHPVAAIGGLRRTVGDIPLNDGSVIPSGSITMTMTLAMQRDGDVFEQPDEFLPRRWEAATDKMNKNWLSFGTGRRACIGQALAQAELLMVVQKLVADYEWTVEEEGHINYSVTLKTLGTQLKAKKVAKA